MAEIKRKQCERPSVRIQRMPFTPVHADLHAACVRHVGSGDVGTLAAGILRHQMPSPVHACALALDAPVLARASSGMHGGAVDGEK